MAKPILCLLLAASFLAGCLDGSQSPSGAPVSGQTSSSLALKTTAASAEPTENLGSIAVTVTTVELQPVAAAQVTIHETSASAFTDAGGAATFNELEPGKYTVLAAKPGFKPAQERGRLVDVLPGEVTEVKLVLDPQEVFNVTEGFHRTHEFRGFISCSFDSTLAGYTSYCGRGLTVSGQTVGRDANDNSTHPWPIESPKVSGIYLEAQWKPSFATLGTDMEIRTSKVISCSAYACQPGGALGKTAAGKSPLRALTVDTADFQVAQAIQPDATKYPATLYSEARAHCSPQCKAAYGNNILIQQSYQMWATAFYGAPPDPAWTALPT